MSQAATVPTNNVPYADLPSTNSRLFEAKARKGLGLLLLTFDEIAKAIGRTRPNSRPEELKQISEVLEVPTGDLQAGLGGPLVAQPGAWTHTSTDPVIYRLYESVLVYGHAIKAIIHEKFGDGIMSMIDCKVRRLVAYVICLRPQYEKNSGR
ncbi:cyanate lyase C-terminal domain-containing protein [Mycena sp. CBHHK59/15]|nr:cyanate lyase C-terminal domain-containing protein [Mycena sp. CBHHK59/15]